MREERDPLSAPSRCPFCVSEALDFDITQWEAKCNEPGDNQELVLIEHRCQDCAMSFWT